MKQKESNDAPALRELFIEELVDVQGGSSDCPDCIVIPDIYTTLACCEEGPHTCC